jgi:hypothetical protein
MHYKVHQNAYKGRLRHCDQAEPAELAELAELAEPAELAGYHHGHEQTARESNHELIHVSSC